MNKIKRLYYKVKYNKVKRLYYISRWFLSVSLTYVALKLLKLADYVRGSNTVIIPDGYYLVKATEVRT